MAKKKNAQVVENVAVGVNAALLIAIANGMVSRVTQEEGLPLINHNPPLIDVNIEDVVDGKAAVRLTEEGFKMIAVDTPVNNAVGNGYAIISNAELPPAKRGGRGGAPVQYPFDKLEAGQSFFVGVSAKHPNPLKTLGSTVSSANMRYSVETGETKQVERTKRGEKNKAVLDANGNKVRESAVVPVRRQTRKFTIRAVKGGTTYGGWTAESDGVLIARVL